MRRRPLLLLLLLLTGVARLPGQTDGARRWAFTTGGSIASSPAAGPDGTIYVGSQDNYLYALTPAGALRWRYLSTDNIDAVPAIGSDGSVYFGSWNGKLTALSSSGTLKWEYVTGSFIVSSPAIGADGSLYVGSGDFSLHAINADGTPKWKYLTGDWVDSSPAVANDGSVYFGSWDGSLYALTSGGELKWSYATGAEILSSPAIGADGRVYVGSDDHKLYAFSPAGVKLWEFTTGDGVQSSPVVDADGSVYIASTDNKLYALTAGGALRWTYTSSASLVSTPALRNGSLIVGTTANSIVCLNVSDGSTLWTAVTGDWVDSSPLVAPDGTIYVGCLDRKLYSLSGNGLTASGGAPWPAFHRDSSRQGRAAVGAPPAIVSQPAALEVTAGASAAFAVGASGSAPFSYQWSKNGAPIGGAVTSILTFANVSPGDAGIYVVAVTNNFGMATSNGAVLTVNAPPAFTLQPVSRLVGAGTNVTFTVAASGTPAPTLQWRKDGSNIAGATNTTLTLTNVQAGDVATYTVVATNLVSATTSSAATLTFGTVPASFDAAAYLARYPDIAAIYGTDLYGAWVYFRDQGIYNGEVFDDVFRVEEYLSLYPELLAVFGTNFSGALMHWLTQGRIEGRLGRIPLLFSEAGYYAHSLTDPTSPGPLPVAFATNRIMAWEHYWAYGIYEGRAFDDEFLAFHYYAMNPDLQVVFPNDWRGLTLHWLVNGRQEGRLGRVPLIFSSVQYGIRNPDVPPVWGNEPTTLWLHYYYYGVYELRNFDDEFRVAEYLQLNPDLQALFGTDYRAAMMHWVRYGRAEGRPGRVP